MQQSLISVIVPCYNQAQYLPETLDSVLAQTYTNWECIIVNDGSPDNTEEIAMMYCEKDERFKYIYQKNGGLASARNTGIRNSQGEFILPLDSDDLIEDTFLEKFVGVFIECPDVKLVCCDVEHFGADNNKFLTQAYNFDNLLFFNPFVCTCMFRKKDYDKTHGYNETMRLGYEDWDFWLTFLVPEDKVYCVREYLFKYRIKRTSMVTQSKQREQEICQQIVENHREYYLPYLKDILYYSRYIGTLEYEVNRLKRSTYYQCGYLIGTPIRLINHFLKRFRHHE